MRRTLIGGGIAVLAAVFLFAAVEGVREYVAPGAWAAEKGKAKTRRQARVRRAPPSGSTPEEIARYFALHGGNIDPVINKQTQAGPFDSGFFFDSGIAPNGGDSPYMN
jgi:hypothetical protein